MFPPHASTAATPMATRMKTATTCCQVSGFSPMLLVVIVTSGCKQMSRATRAVKGWAWPHSKEEVHGHRDRYGRGFSPRSGQGKSPFSLHASATRDTAIVYAAVR